MPVTRRSFEDGIRGLSSTSASNNRTPDVEANRQSSRLSEYVSRPLATGKRASSLTVRLGDSSRSTGGTLAQSLRTALARSSSAYRADYTISGTRVGTDNLTGAPLANESGSATLHRGLATGSNVTQIKVPAPKADLPGVPAILTRGSPLLGNRQVLMNFLKGSSFGGSVSQGSSINTNSIPLEDDCNPGFTSVKFENEDEPEEPPLPPEDQGGSPLEPDEPPPPPVNFNCTPTGCVKSASGIYDTLPECEAQCQQRYSCKDGDCVPDPNGNHANLSLCLNACQSRYTCVDGACVAFPSGGYATLLECSQACEVPLEYHVYRITWSGRKTTGFQCDNTKCDLPVEDEQAFTSSEYPSYRPPSIEQVGTAPAPGYGCCTETFRIYNLFTFDENGDKIYKSSRQFGGCLRCDETFKITMIS